MLLAVVVLERRHEQALAEAAGPQEEVEAGVHPLQRLDMGGAVEVVVPFGYHRVEIADTVRETCVWHGVRVVCGQR